MVTTAPHHGCLYIQTIKLSIYNNPFWVWVVDCSPPNFRAVTLRSHYQLHHLLHTPSNLTSTCTAWCRTTSCSGPFVLLSCTLSLVVFAVVVFFVWCQSLYLEDQQLLTVVCIIVPANKLLVEVMAPGCFEEIYPRAGLVCSRASGWYDKLNHVPLHCSLETNGDFLPFSSKVRMCNWVTIGLCDRTLFHKSKVLVCWIFLNVVTRNGAETQDRTEKSPLTTALCMKISHSVTRRCNLESNQKLQSETQPDMMWSVCPNSSKRRAPVWRTTVQRRPMRIIPRLQSTDWSDYDVVDLCQQHARETNTNEHFTLPSIIGVPTCARSDQKTAISSRSWVI